MLQARQTRSSQRRIVFRTRGHRRGPITRLMSPGDLGEILKPFVFLDLFEAERGGFQGFGLHPHSGIATVTYLFEGNTRYEDTSGATGLLEAGGVEWFKAAHGAWHGGGSGDAPRSRGFQLWLALPPDQELGDVESIYQAADAVAADGPARVLLGAYGNAKSTLRAPSPLNYLAVHLKAGETWRYQPPKGHSVAWLALAAGEVLAPEKIDAGEVVVFEHANTAIAVQATADSELVLGSAVPHDHDLVLGYYSVHTSPETLAAGEQRIRALGAQLRKQGRL